jgi:hypothetical protein
MKTLSTKLLIVLSVVLSFISCKKDKDPSLQTKPQPTEHQANFSFVDNFSSSNYELIVTDSNGTYLLDTILPVNKIAAAKFLSNETKFNITTIEFSDNRYYNVKTYYQVNPSQWNINQNFVQVHQPKTVDLAKASHLYFKNVPKLDPLLLSFPLYTGGNEGSYNPNANTVLMDYNKPDPYYSYVSIPSLGLYKFHQTATNHDTVSLAKMDSLVSITYPIGFDVTPYNTRELIGYTKKNDYSTYTRLWDDQYDYWKTYGDFMYPPTGVEQYLLRYTVFDDNLRAHYTQVLSDKMPTTLEFLDDSYVNVINKDPNNFEIAFPKAKPSVYGLYFGSTSTDSLTWTVLLPANKTSLKGTGKLVDLKKSKLLKTFDFSSVVPMAVQLTKADDYNYYDYLNIIFDPNASGAPQKIMKWMDYSTSNGF